MTSFGSILDNGTKANNDIAYYSGGGGGGGSTNLVASTLTVSSINGLLGPSGSLTCNGPLLMQNGGIAMNLDSIIWAAGAPGDTLAWNGNDGQIAGVSTINGVPYPPAASGGGCFQLVSAGTVPLTGGTGGAASNCTAAFTTVPLTDYYRASICFVYNQVSGTPAGNAFLFFQSSGNTTESIHIPLSSITPNIPAEISLVFSAATASTAIQVGLNDSAASQITVAISNLNAHPAAILEKLGAPQALT